MCREWFLIESTDKNIFVGDSIEKMIFHNKFEATIFSAPELVPIQRSTLCYLYLESFVCWVFFFY